MEVETIVDKKTDNLLKKKINALTEDALERKMGDLVGNEVVESDEDLFDDGDDADGDDDTDSPRTRRGLFTTSVQPQKKSEILTEADKLKIRKKAEEAKKSQEWDIFTDVGEEYYKGDNPLMVKYDISLGNITLGTKFHPYSWEKLQAEFTPIHGAGKYTVRAKDPITSQVIKTQPRALAKLDVVEKVSEKENSNNGGFTLAEIARMEQARAEREEERRRNDEARADNLRREMEAKNERLQAQLDRERKEAEERNRQWTERMIQMSQPKGGGFSDFFKEFMASPLATVIVPKIMNLGESKESEKLETYKLIRDIQDENRKTLESITKSFEKQVSTLAESIKEIKAETSTGNGKGGLQEMLSTFKMIKEIEDEGREKAEKMYEWRRELEAERKEEDEATVKSDSMLERLAMTAMPLLAGAIAQKSQAPARISQATRPALPPTRPQNVAPAQNPAVVQPRGAVSPVTTQVVRPRTSANPERIVRTPVQTTQAQASEAVNHGSQGRTIARQGSQRGVSGVNDLLAEARREIAVETANEEVLTPVAQENVAPTNSIPHLKDEENISRITTAILPVAMEALGAMATANSQAELVKETATKSINSLIESNVDLASVERDFDDETLNAILGMIPEDYHSLLKDLKHEIVHQIRSGEFQGQTHN